MHIIQVLTTTTGLSVCVFNTPTNSNQLAGKWWKSQRWNGDIMFYVLPTSVFVSESAEWSSDAEEQKHKIWASDRICSYF